MYFVTVLVCTQAYHCARVYVGMYGHTVDYTLKLPYTGPWPFLLRLCIVFDTRCP